MEKHHLNYGDKVIFNQDDELAIIIAVKQPKEKESVLYKIICKNGQIIDNTKREELTFMRPHHQVKYTQNLAKIEERLHRAKAMLEVAPTEYSKGIVAGLEIAVSILKMRENEENEENGGK